MKKILGATALLAASTTLASAGGLDRSNQPIGIIFEEGNRVELTFGFASPDVTGVDAATGATTGNITDSFITAGFAIKYDFTDKFSLAVIIDEPYGSDLEYPNLATAPVLAGTRAIVDSTAVTAVGRYKFNENFSVHGGIRYQQLSADVLLSGAAFAPVNLNGYRATFSSDEAFGYLIGAAYERPEIALRVALTYNSEITHDLTTSQSVGFGAVNLPSSVTEIIAPESINLEFQTGIAKDTLLFGSVRYASYDDTLVVTSAIAPNSLTDLESSVDFTIGIGRKFSDKWSGFVSYTQNSEGDDAFVSALAPTNGSKAITIGGKYTLDAVEISGGIRYTDLGDAVATIGGNPVQPFSGNDAVSAGLKIAYKF